MKRIIGLIITSLFFVSGALADPAPKMLMVVSGYGLDEGKTQPGFEMQEFASAYWIFADHGLDIDVASPSGGAVVADRFDPDHPDISRLHSDEVASSAVSDTLAIKDLTNSYDAVFVVGGKGAMFDLPGHEPLQEQIANIYESGGIVSAVCHGPAALTEVRLEDASYLVAGKKVNGFSNQEERLFSRRWIETFDFMLEDRLIERGGDFSAGPMMLNYVVEDSRLITGQNPASTAAVAEAVLGQMGVQVMPRQLDEQERTFALIADLLNGSDESKKKLSSDGDQYNRQLIGMYLYYYAMGATSQIETSTALELMALIPEQLKHPKIQLQIARSHLALDQTQPAKQVLEQLAESHPEFTEAMELLATVNQ